MIDVTDSNKKYYYHFDGLGSVVALSNTSGNIVERYEYDAFGEPNSVSDVNNPYYFTARRLDTETGLYYYRARYYKPDIGRFLQTDPIGYSDSMNLYQYCLNNSVNCVDPSGLLRLVNRTRPPRRRGGVGFDPRCGFYRFNSMRRPSADGNTTGLSGSNSNGPSSSNCSGSSGSRGGSSPVMRAAKKGSGSINNIDGEYMRRMEEFMRNRQGYTECNTYAGETLKWGLGNEYYELKEILREGYFLGHRYVGVYDRRTDQLVRIYDPWMPPWPYPFHNYNMPSGRWIHPPSLTPDWAWSDGVYYHRGW